MKVDTIAKFKLLSYLKEQFDTTQLTVIFIAENVAMVTDRVGDRLYFKYENGKITHQDKP